MTKNFEVMTPMYAGPGGPAGTFFHNNLSGLQTANLNLGIMEKKLDDETRRPSYSKNFSSHLFFSCGDHIPANFQICSLSGKKIVG
jgi:hypothetical protein